MFFVAFRILDSFESCLSLIYARAYVALHLSLAPAFASHSDEDLCASAEHV